MGPKGPSISVPIRSISEDKDRHLPEADPDTDRFQRFKDRRDSDTLSDVLTVKHGVLLTVVPVTYTGQVT